MVDKDKMVDKHRMVDKIYHNEHINYTHTVVIRTFSYG